MRLALVVVAMIALCACQGKEKKAEETPTSPYAPWNDLSAYFDLGKVVSVNPNLSKFTSSTLCYGKLPLRNERLNDNAYTATVLGLNVLLRSEPIITPRTIKGSVNTGDDISVLSYSEYHNGKYWNRVQVTSGNCVNYYGYICTDYLIAKDQYLVLHDHVFSSPYSNIYIYDESKYLNAISLILLKLNVGLLHQNLAVSIIDTKKFGNYEVVTFQLRDTTAQQNDTLLAFVQFEKGKNDYHVLGVVPGKFAGDMQRLFDGSYEIYFTK